MKRVLVIQLARFGDLIQTKRTMSSLAAEPCEVHLAADHALAGLARRLYPYASVHGVAAHGLPDPGGADAASAIIKNARVFAELAALSFDEVYCLNFSGLSLAMTTAFDPDSVRGYKLVSGQIHKDPWARLAFRWAKKRRLAGLNLTDFWAALAPSRVPPESVNPKASPRGGGVGVALAGRNARRALPPEVLASIVQTVFASGKAQRLVLLGAKGQEGLARDLSRRLKPGIMEKTSNLCGRTSLDALCDEVSNLDLLLTPDTGVMHLAAHFGVPVTAFFLSSAWCHETGPYGEGHVVWQSVVESAPCLESAPCPDGLRCLESFASPAFLPVLAGARGKEPPPGLAGFRTDFDALGVVCRPFAGTDPVMGRRLAFRAFAARRLGLEIADGPAATPDLAATLDLETDWTLDQARRPDPFETV